MCGIAGIISRAPLSDPDLEQVHRLTTLLLHRGPDGEGFFTDAQVALGMRRLSIIDLAGGWQPLYNEDKTLALIANGEVYNFIELRQQLEAQGHQFRTGSDCETIVHLYEQYGDDFVSHLRGMYAFALWDGKQRRVLIGRDRMGEKPLYLVQTKDKLVFASELKAIVGAGVVPFELEPIAIHLYYHYGYIPEPVTAVKGVRKLPAASLLSIDLDQWRIEQSRYWNMAEAPPLNGKPAELIREQLETISELIIRSEVPVGVALSGGLDSSVIATLAAKKYPGSMHAFTVGYAGVPLQDERQAAKQLADHLGMPFHNVELAPSDMVSAFSRMVFSRDDPIADGAGSSYYAVMQAARAAGVPVMLMGQGGDELFWGYSWVRSALRANERKLGYLQGKPAGLLEYMQLTRPPLSYTGALRWLNSAAGIRTGLHRYRSDRSSPADRMVMYDMTPTFREADRHLGATYASQFVEQIDPAAAFDPFTVPQPWPELDVAMTRLISEVYLRENGIAQGDRLSMASSVELRLPLVDYRLVETVIGLRKAQPDAHLAPKQWLISAIRDLVPPFVLERKKRGFTPPWRTWHNAIFRAYGQQLADGWLVRNGVLRADVAERMSRDFLVPYVGLPMPLSDLSLVLEIWCDQMQSAAHSRPSAHFPRGDDRRLAGGVRMKSLAV